MSIIEITLDYIDRRIENYSLPLFARIIETYIKGSLKNTNALFLLRTALRTANFFEFEKACWDKVQQDEPLSDEEINQFLKMKSSDALFYGRVIKIFTPCKNFTVPKKKKVPLKSSLI